MEYQNKTITLKDGRTALLRAVCKEDAIPMIAYMKACYEQTPYLMRYPDEFAVTAEQEATYLERQLVSPDVLMLVCEVEGKLAGNCQLELKPLAQDPTPRAGRHRLAEGLLGTGHRNSDV